MRPKLLTLTSFDLCKLPSCNLVLYIYYATFKHPYGKMPPRKKARVSQATSPTPTSQPKTPTPAQSSPSKTEQQLLDDPWTDEEEIGLFKGLMRWKPTGTQARINNIC